MCIAFLEKKVKVLVARLCLTLQPHGISPSKNTGVDSHSLLQQIFPTQGLNLDLLHCRQILYHLNQKIADIMDSFCTKALESKIF